MWRLYREAWFVGNVTKYLERYRDKDGIKDLEKARHYLEKLIELEKADAEEIRKIEQEKFDAALDEAHDRMVASWQDPSVAPADRSGV